MIDRKILREVTIAELASVTVGLFAGIGLARATDRFIAVPGIFVILPMLLGMSNDIDGSLAARLGSALHMGVIRPKSPLSRELYNVVSASFVLSVFESVSAGILAHILCLATGLRTVGLTGMIFVALFGGFLGKVMTIPITTTLSIFFFNRGIDPDSVMGPVLTSYSDIFTMASLYLVTGYIGNLTDSVLLEDGLGLSVIAVLLICFIYINRRRKTLHKKRILNDMSQIVFESLPMILIPLALTAPAGLALGFFEDLYLTNPVILLLLLPLNDMAGDYGCIVSSRLSTALHIGRVRPKFMEIGALKDELITIFTTGVITSLYMGLACYIVSVLLGLGYMEFGRLIILTLVTGTSLIAFEIPLSIAVNFISYSKGLNPDNVTIPIVTDLGDTGGILFLIVSALLLGLHG